MTEFEEYLRGTFEINNGIENDVDALVRIHAPVLLKLAKKELMKDAVHGEVNIWGSYISLPKVLPSEFSKQRVKVIIIKE